MIAGADEAGKGALYGPAVLALVWLTQQQLDTLVMSYTLLF